MVPVSDACRHGFSPGRSGRMTSRQRRPALAQTVSGVALAASAMTRATLRRPTTPTHPDWLSVSSGTGPTIVRAGAPPLAGSARTKSEVGVYAWTAEPGPRLVPSRVSWVENLSRRRRAATWSDVNPWEEASAEALCVQVWPREVTVTVVVS